MLTVRDTTLLGMGIDRDADRGVVASHAQVDHELPVDRIRGRVVSGLVIALAVVAVVGLVALWPRSDEDLGPVVGQLPTANAVVTGVQVVPCAGTKIDDAVDCFQVSALISNGVLRAEPATFELPIGGSSPDFNKGDRIRLAYDVASDPPLFYFYDFQRTTPLLLLGLIFVTAVVLLGGWRGLGALCGLAASLIILVVFTLPSILDGRVVRSRWRWSAQRLSR